MALEGTNDRLYRAVAESIRARREELRFSQKGLAQSLSISRESLVNIERNKQRPPLHVLWEISIQLNIELRELIPLQSSISELSIPKNLNAEIDKAIPGAPIATKETLAKFIQEATSNKPPSI